MCGNAVFLSMSSKVSPLNPKNTKRTINEERKVFADKWLAHLERRFHPMKGNESALTCFIWEIKGYYAPQGFLSLVDSNSDSDSDLIYFSLGLTSIAISSESDWNRNWSRAVWKSHKTTLYRQLDKRKLPKKYDKDWAFLFSFAYSYVLSIVILYDDTIKKINRMILQTPSEQNYHCMIYSETWTCTTFEQLWSKCEADIFTARKLSLRR